MEGRRNLPKKDLPVKEITKDQQQWTLEASTVPPNPNHPLRRQIEWVDEQAVRTHHTSIDNGKKKWDKNLPFPWRHGGDQQKESHGQILGALRQHTCDQEEQQHTDTKDEGDKKKW